MIHEGGYLIKALKTLEKMPANLGNKKILAKSYVKFLPVFYGSCMSFIMTSSSSTW
jgi:hypothetical protein